MTTKDMNWDDLRVILMMIRHGSLAKAAAVLGVNYTTVARRISQAEARYGVRLFERFPAGYVPTAEAEAAARIAEAMEIEEAQFRLQLGKADQTLTGTLTITAPQLLITHHINHIFTQFQELCPEVRLAVLASDNILNLNQREADIAFRISNQPGDSLTGQRLSEQVVAAYANAEYAEKLKSGRMTNIDWIGFTFWENLLEPRIPEGPEHRVRLQFDNMVSVVGAAQAGLGVARMPRFLGRASGLTEVPLMTPEPYADIWLVAHRDLWASAKVTAFRKLVMPWFRAHAADFV